MSDPCAIVDFEIRDGCLEEAEAAIREFVAEIEKKEPGTCFYYSLREKDNPRLFSHVMSFQDQEQHEAHRKTEHVSRFVEKLYPLCEEKPSPRYFAMLAGVQR